MAEEDCTNTLRCSSHEKINKSPYSQNTCIGNCQCVPENLSSNSCAFVGCQKYKLAKDTCTGICTVKECCTTYTCSMVKDKTIDGYFYDTAKENTICPGNDADSCLTNPNLCFTKKVQCKDLDPRINNEIMQVLVLPKNYYYDPSKGERYCNSNNTSSCYENKNYDLCFTKCKDEVVVFETDENKRKTAEKEACSEGGLCKRSARRTQWVNTRYKEKVEQEQACLQSKCCDLQYTCKDIVNKNKYQNYEYNTDADNDTCGISTHTCSNNVDTCFKKKAQCKDVKDLQPPAGYYYDSSKAETYCDTSDIASCTKNETDYNICFTPKQLCKNASVKCSDAQTKKENAICATKNCTPTECCERKKTCKHFDSCITYNLKKKTGIITCKKACTVGECCETPCGDISEYFDISSNQCTLRSNTCNAGYESNFQSDFEDKICICKPPADITGYILNEKSNRTDTGFDVSAACDKSNGYVGIAQVEKCDAKGSNYSLSGCRLKCNHTEYFDSKSQTCTPLSVCASNEIETSPPQKNMEDDEFISNRVCESFSCKDGEYVKLDESNSPVKDANNQVICERKCPDVKNEYYVADEVEDGIFLKGYSLKSKTDSKWRTLVPENIGCKTADWDYSTSCYNGNPDENSEYSVKESGEVPIGLRVEVVKADVEKPTFVYENDKQPLLHIPQAYPSVQFEHWGQVNQQYALEALKNECDTGQYKDKCDGIIFNPNRSKCSNSVLCYNNNTSNGLVFLKFKDEYLPKGMKETIDGVEKVKLQDTRQQSGIYFQKTDVEEKPAIKIRCENRKEYQDDDPGTSSASRHWRYVFRSKKSAIAFKQCLQSKKTQDACWNEFEAKDREAKNKVCDSTKEECLEKTTLHFTNYLRAGPDGAHPGCTLYQRLVREPGLPSYCEDICDFTKEYYDKDSKQCMSLNLHKRCHRGQKCTLSTKFSDNLCDSDVCSNGDCDGLWPNTDGKTNFQFSSKANHTFSCNDNEVYTYYKPPKRRFGWTVTNIEKNICKPTNEYLNGYYDNKGFQTTASTYACNREAKNKVCDSSHDTIEGYNVKRLSEYACWANTKTNTSNCKKQSIRLPDTVPLHDILQQNNIQITEEELYKCFYENEDSEKCLSLKNFRSSKYYTYVDYLCNTELLKDYPRFFKNYANYLTTASESLYLSLKKMIVNDDGIQIKPLQVNYDTGQYESFKRINYSYPNSCTFPAGPKCRSYDAKMRTIFIARNMYGDKKNALNEYTGGSPNTPMARMPIISDGKKIMCKDMFPQGEVANGQYIDAKQRTNDLLDSKCSIESSESDKYILYQENDNKCNRGDIKACEEVEVNPYFTVRHKSKEQRECLDKMYEYGKINCPTHFPLSSTCLENFYKANSTCTLHKISY